MEGRLVGGSQVPALDQVDLTIRGPGVANGPAMIVVRRVLRYTITPC